MVGQCMAQIWCFYQIFSKAISLISSKGTAFTPNIFFIRIFLKCLDVIAERCFIEIFKRKKRWKFTFNFSNLLSHCHRITCTCNIYQTMSSVLNLLLKNSNRHNLHLLSTISLNICISNTFIRHAFKLPISYYLYSLSTPIDSTQSCVRRPL